MSAYTIIKEIGKTCSFRVDYPYYGLFGTAEVSVVSDSEKVFECKLKNRQTVRLKKVGSKWFDTLLNEETALSNVIGTSIDDYYKK